MTKDVLISVKGTQFIGAGADDSIEVITNGSYYKRNNKHYIIYEEIIDGATGITKNQLKFDDSMVNISRTGAISTNMLFEENKRNISNYMTPFGGMCIGTEAKKIDVTEDDDEIKVFIDYSIDVDSQHVTDSKIELSIKAMEKGRRNDN